MKTFGWCLVSAGFALLLAFAAATFEAGIIVDAAGGVGTLTPVHAAIGVGGGILVVAGIATFVFASRRHRAQTPPAGR